MLDATLSLNRWVRLFESLRSHVGSTRAGSQTSKQLCTTLAAQGVWKGNATPGTRISCQVGTVWITCSGDARDYLLHAGQELIVPQSGMVVVQAIGAVSTFCWSSPYCGRRKR
ncbi:MAG: DUF2917 domain-containing protein [Abitibacteriaceae bacterium]|nr:DUF2917 domain-containing protein [Abditibacteriaceae bacterium]MBV9868026.1 DUF2917 domain-containing protein [Abditibacteriaceae bacterium]